MLQLLFSFCRCFEVCRGNREGHNQNTDGEEVEGDSKWNADVCCGAL